MRRLILNYSLISLLLVGCSDSVGPFDCATDAPNWLSTRLESLSPSSDYIGTTVYRYEWRGAPVYHIEIPVSSCAYCELYDQTGEQMEFADEAEFQDFLENKANEAQVCEWNE